MNWTWRQPAQGRGAQAGAGRVIALLCVLFPAVAMLAVLAGGRFDSPRAPASLPDRQLVTSWRLRANPAYSRVQLPPRYPYARLIARVADRHGLPAELIAGVVYVESRFNPRAVSHKGAVGLMQLLPSTARPLARKLGWRHFDLMDPATNLELGTYFLKDRLREYGGDLAAALSYYNGGRWGIVSRGRYRNRGYIRRVMSSYRKFDAESAIAVAARPPAARAPDGPNAMTPD